MNIVATNVDIEHNAFEIFFFSGCTQKCKGCHNRELWDFNQGLYWKEYLTKYNVADKIKNPLVNKIVVLGGEPLNQNLDELFEFLKEIDKFGKEIWLFTSFDDHEVSYDDEARHVISYVDYIKYGRYEKELEVDDNIQYGYKLATSNQIIKCMPRSKEFQDNFKKLCNKKL